MARTNIAAQTTPGAYPTLPIGAGTRDLATTPADVANGNETSLIDSKTLVLVYNSGASPHTVTFDSVAIPTYNREGDITAYSVGAGEISLFGPFKTAGWANSGKLYIDANHAEILFMVITLP
jgi:hypothetical protein